VPEPIEPIDENDLRRLAEQRRTLERKRRGRSSLVIDPTLGTAGPTPTSALKIPTDNNG
jgi:hypothetical protein